MILITIPFHGNEGKVGRKKESAKKIFGTTPFQSREGTLFDISYRKGTFLLSSYDIEQELQKGLSCS